MPARGPRFRPQRMHTTACTRQSPQSMCTTVFTRQSACSRQSGCSSTCGPKGSKGAEFPVCAPMAPTAPIGVPMAPTALELAPPPPSAMRADEGRGRAEAGRARGADSGGRCAAFWSVHFGSVNFWCDGCSCAPTPPAGSLELDCAPQEMVLRPPPPVASRLETRAEAGRSLEGRRF